jgi:hypothetical protein
MRPWSTALAVVACAGALALALGWGYAGYDASWSLVWGRELAQGGLPSYQSVIAPTPHPLANAVAAVLSALDDGGEDALVGLTYLSFAGLLAGAWTLVARLWWWPAGCAAALLLATRGLLDREVAFASLDLPFLALVVWAGVLEAHRPRRGEVVLAVLALAGLLRPEAWLLSLAYLAWIGRAGGGRDWGDLRAAALLTVAAPVLWTLSDLVITGDPWHSLTGTRDLGADLDRPTGFSTALRAVPSSLADLMGALPLGAGLLGLVAGLLLAPRRVALVLGALCCGVATFLAIGLAGLPVLLRYLLLPAAMLSLSAAVGLTLPKLVRGGIRGVAAAMVSAAVAALLIASVPGTIDDVRAARAFSLARGNVHADLRALVATPAFRAAAMRCPQIRVPDFRTRPVLLIDAPIDPARIVVGNLADGERGLLLTYATAQTARIFNLGAPGEAPLQALPAAGRLVARNESWVAAAVC